MIRNPILKGCNPDPSLLSVGSDYYIATSTFEWFPGIAVYHSNDLVSWNQLRSPLTSLDQLSLQGVPDSCGILAPNLTYNDGLYYLVYTVMWTWSRKWRDVSTFLVTSPCITEGPWSSPTFLTSRGFDYSLFHDEKSKCKYLIGVFMNHDLPRNELFGGVDIQEYDCAAGKLVGERKPLNVGTGAGFTEAPRICLRGSYYYLLLAEGGVHDSAHQMTVLRSCHPCGPYSLHPDNPLVCSISRPDYPLQRCGHGNLMKASDGSWYVSMLVVRPIGPKRRCLLGRETAIERVLWEDDWPILEDSCAGSKVPRLVVPVANRHMDKKRVGTSNPLSTSIISMYDFRPGKVRLGLEYQALRRPFHSSWISYADAQPGRLRLRGQHSLASRFLQALVARRITEPHIRYSACLRYHPKNRYEMAGVVLFYNTGNYLYLCCSYDDKHGVHVRVLQADNFRSREQSPRIPVMPQPSNNSDQLIILQVEVNNNGLASFSFSVDNGNCFQEIAKLCDASNLSDDYVCRNSGSYLPAFTGCFVGICCQDLGNGSSYCDFAWLKYEEKQ